MSMKYFDLHCDTITECLEKNVSLFDNGLHVDLKKTGDFSLYCQCFAAWIPDTLRGQDAVDRLNQIHQKLVSACKDYSDDIRLLRCSEELPASGNVGFFTVENGAALGGSLQNLDLLKSYGTKMMTLTWNGENELGRGVLATGNTGLSPFGKTVVRAMEEKEIVVDVSHASPELFWDVASIAAKPFVATHSNARSVCSHPRNLTDEQFKEIVARKGLVGLNFCRSFLNDQGEKADFSDIIRHAQHFLDLGGEDVVCIGGDLDGASLPFCMEGVGSMPALYHAFLEHGFSEHITDKIFFENAYRFFSDNKL